MKIVFAGTPDFALPPLDALGVSAHEIVAVYTQPDRPKGRGRKLTASPVKERALKLGLDVYQPATLRDAEAQRELASLEPDLMVVVAYGLLLPPAVLEIPKYGCINIHASLLPRWRGAAPIQHALMHGDEMTGVSIMQMDPGLDTGPVLMTSELLVGHRDTSGDVHDALAAFGADALMEAIYGIEAGTLTPEPQDNEHATYAPKIRRSDARLDWSMSAKELVNRVRAFNPVPGAETRLGGKQLKIWDASVTGDTSDKTPGSVIAAGEAGIDVATGDGVLRIHMLQLPGRGRVRAEDFIHAFDIDGETLDAG